MENRRKHYFPENDITVITGLLPTGEFGAYRDELDDGLIRGHGHTRLAAIADLYEQIGHCEDLRTAMDREAFWDRVRDERKHSVL